MRSRLACSAAAWLVVAMVAQIQDLTVAAGEDYAVKPADTKPPEEIAESIRKLLSEKSIQLQDGKGTVLCEVWLRQEVPAQATVEQVKNGLSYREIPESTILGAIKFPSATKDYRKQAIKAGAYTLRLAFQPDTGDHMGTAPHQDFCLLVPAAEDKDEKTMAAKALIDLSIKAGGTSHPCPLLLFPVSLKDAAKDPRMVNKGEGHWVLTAPVNIKTDDGKGQMGIGLTLIGVSAAAPP